MNFKLVREVLRKSFELKIAHENEQKTKNSEIWFENSGRKFY